MLDVNDKNNNDKNKNNKRRRRYNRSSKKRRTENETPIIRIVFKDPTGPQQEEPVTNPYLPNININDEYFADATSFEELNIEIKTLNDLIKLGESYDPESEVRYVINLKALHRCVEPLKELENMIGMEDIKKNILNLVFFHLQDLGCNGGSTMKHTILEGDPGSGKTEVATIIAKLYYGLGITQNDTFLKFKRSDMIGKYLGHTAAKTQECFDKCKGGVMFIDEAYALGNEEGRDSFSKECIDCINQNLTEMSNNIILIIAGYKNQLNSSFFSYNPGLYRRFPFRFSTGNPSPSELRLIFKKKVIDGGWFIKEPQEKNLELKFFEDNKEYFKFNGGDMETLFYMARITHSKNIFGKNRDLRKLLTKKDITDALDLFLTNDEVKNRTSKIREDIVANMYI